MASPAVTYTFANSTTADATQVNQNFTDLINSLTDGTKSLSIDALTCAGTVTLNGNVTLGNASSDDITITGSIAAAIAIKTKDVVDIGSSTIGLKRIYFGNATNSNTVGVLGGVTTSSYTITLPVAAPAGAGAVMEFTTGGVASFVSRTDLAVVSKTTTYNPATRWDDLILASGSAFTITLPAASDSKKSIRVKKTDSSLTNIITISRAGSDTIEDGILTGQTSTTLNTINEEVELVSDGTSKWYVRRTIPSGWVSFTPTGSWSTNATFTGFYKRNGDSAHFRMKCAMTGSPGTGAAFTFNLPITIDTAKLVDAVDGVTALGDPAIARDAGSGTNLVQVYYSTTTAVSLRLKRASGTNLDDGGAVDQNNPMVTATGDYYTAEFTVPVSGWKS